MTPEARAKKAADEYIAEHEKACLGPDVAAYILAPIIAAAIREAVEEEREACAQYLKTQIGLSKAYGQDASRMGQALKRIRARSATFPSDTVEQ